MARKRSGTLTDGELRLMEVLWQRGESTVGEVVEALQARPVPAYSTVLTMLRILESKGYLKHRKSGRAFVYYPVVQRNDAQRNALKQLLSKFFNNSAELLVLNILEEENISRSELQRLKKKIDQSK
jgi:BlaI family transcriptional regulator, penicillinase repressor